MPVRGLKKGLLLVGACSATPVWAGGTAPGDQNDNCKIEIVQSPSVDWRGLRGRGYEIFDPTQTYEPFELHLRHTGNACRFHVALSPQGGNAELPGVNGGALAFDVVSGPGGRSLLSKTYGGTDTSIITGEAPAGDWRTVLQLYLAIPPRQMALAGRYTGGVVARLFAEDKRGVSSPVSEASALFSAYVPGQVRTRLDGMAAGGTLSLDFGELGLLPSRSLNLHLETNDEVTIALSSTNGGKLLHQSGKVGVPYSVRAGNVDVAMSGRTILPLSASDAVGGYNMPLVLNVDKAAGTLVAGQYKDTLIVTIAAR